MQINDTYAIPEELDLDCDNRKWLAPGADPKVRNLYCLHSVLVQSAEGPYYAFIRPTGDTYFKFDDEQFREPS